MNGIGLERSERNLYVKGSIDMDKVCPNNSVEERTNRAVTSESTYAKIQKQKLKLDSCFTLYTKIN